MPKDENGKIQTGDTDYVDTYKAMEKCLKSGKTKAIGISNFSEVELERLLKETSCGKGSFAVKHPPYITLYHLEQTNRGGFGCQPASGSERDFF